MSLRQPIPERLKIFSSILEKFGLFWSDHYHPNNKPENCWGLINKEGHAGRVGMSVDEAEQDAILTINSKIQKMQTKFIKLRGILKFALEKTGEWKEL